MPQPEQVHWLFATGFLALGLFLLAEAVVGAEVWRKRRWRAYLWPSHDVPDGRRHVAGDGLLHVLDPAHARPRGLGRGDDDRRCRGARPAAGSCATRSGDSRSSMPSSSPASRSSSTSRTIGSSNAPRSCTTCSAGLPDFGDLPARPGHPPARDRVRDRVRAGFVVVGISCTPTATWRPLRPSVAACGRAAPMKRLAVPGFVIGLVCPAAAFAHATLKSEQPEFRQRFETSPARVALHFDQGVHALPELDRRLRRARKDRLREGAQCRRRAHDVRARSTGCRAARTPSAGTRSRATRTSSPACTHSAFASTLRRPPRRTAHPGRRGARTSCAGSTSSRSRSLSAGLASGCSCCPGRFRPGWSVASTSSPESG